MTDATPDGPTDPRLTPPEEHTTFVSPPTSPPPDPPPGFPPASPASEPAGRVYSTGVTGESSYGGGAGEGGPGGAARAGADRGRTTIADEVVEQVIEKIVNLSVDQVAGVHGLYAPPLAGGAGPADGDPESRAVSVRLDGDQAEINISIQVEFGHAVHEVVEQVRSDVIGQAERLLGLTVTQVNVLVADVTFDPSG